MRWQPGAMITAAATTAPQVGATPTSSTPTTRVSPSFHRRRSWRRVGTMTAIDGKGSASTGKRTTPLGRCAGRRGASAALAVLGRAPLAQGGRLADPVAQEVQLGTADLAVADDLDLVDARAV